MDMSVINVNVTFVLHDLKWVDENVPCGHYDKMAIAFGFLAHPRVPYPQRYELLFGISVGASHSFCKQELHQFYR
ncbi:hypothetical protein SUGI_0765310 [Cryptomeria japonica]|nr:hypothetical protein SUGI_0765310 [Cryptomeria japonica]